MEAAGKTGPDNGKEVEDRSLLVLYGTETGHSQEIAHEIADTAERLRFRTTVEQMNDVSLVRTTSGSAMAPFLLTSDA